MNHGMQPSLNSITVIASTVHKYTSCSLAWRHIPPCTGTPCHIPSCTGTPHHFYALTDTPFHNAAFIGTRCDSCQYSLVHHITCIPAFIGTASQHSLARHPSIQWYNMWPALQIRWYTMRFASQHALVHRVAQHSLPLMCVVCHMTQLACHVTHPCFHWRWHHWCTECAPRHPSMLCALSSLLWLPMHNYNFSLHHTWCRHRTNAFSNDPDLFRPRLRARPTEHTAGGEKRQNLTITVTSPRAILVSISSIKCNYE